MDRVVSVCMSLPLGGVRLQAGNYSLFVVRSGTGAAAVDVARNGSAVRVYPGPPSEATSSLQVGQGCGSCGMEQLHMEPGS